MAWSLLPNRPAELASISRRDSLMTGEIALGLVAVAWIALAMAIMIKLARLAKKR